MAVHSCVGWRRFLAGLPLLVLVGRRRLRLLRRSRGGLVGLLCGLVLWPLQKSTREAGVPAGVACMGFSNSAKRFLDN